MDILGLLGLYYGTMEAREGRVWIAATHGSHPLEFDLEVQALMTAAFLHLIFGRSTGPTKDL